MKKESEKRRRQKGNEGDEMRRKGGRGVLGELEVSR